MPDIPNQPPQPPQPAQQAASPQPSATPSQQPPPTNHRSPYLLALFTFILGVIGGILLFITYPRFANKPAPAALTPAPSPSPLALPTNEPSPEASPSANLSPTGIQVREIIVAPPQISIANPSPQNITPAINDVSNLPKDKCPCWDGINSTCLPQSACQ